MSTIGVTDLVAGLVVFAVEGSVFTVAKRLGPLDVATVSIVAGHLGGPDVVSGAVGLTNLRRVGATTLLGHGTLVTVTVVATVWTGSCGPFVDAVGDRTNFGCVAGTATSPWLTLVALPTRHTAVGAEGSAVPLVTGVGRLASLRVLASHTTTLLGVRFTLVAVAVRAAIGAVAHIGGRPGATGQVAGFYVSA